MDKNCPVGVMDSGVGGISILRALTSYLPEEDYIFYADSAHAPYGEKERDEIKRLSMRAAGILMDHGCKALVVACNTATAAAIVDLRAKYPEIPVIGLEPALKPAALSMPHPRIVVMATLFTLKEDKFLNLERQFEDQAEIIPVPCPMLVRFVERGELYSQAVVDYVRQQLAPYQDRPIDAIVLGCTHFPFVRKAVIEAAGPGVRLFDSEDGVERRLKKLMEERDMLHEPGKRGTVKFLSSKGIEGLEICRRLYEM